jgi:hypothetical protein
MLKKNLGRAQMHSLLALVWSEMQGLPSSSDQLGTAVLQLRRDHREFEDHRRQSHKML